MNGTRTERAGRRIGSRSGLRRFSGHTLLEVLTAMGIGAIVLSGVLSSFVFLNRGSISLGNYTDMNRSGRIATERIGAEIRAAERIIHADPEDLEMLVPGADGELHRVRIRFDPDAGALYIVEGGQPRRLLEDLSEFAFTFHGRTGPAEGMMDIRQIAFRGVMLRKTARMENTDYLFSARFLMRNRIP